MSSIIIQNTASCPAMPPCVCEGQVPTFVKQIPFFPKTLILK